MADFVKDEFIDSCVGRAVGLGVWPEYVLAVAQARSGMKDLSGGSERGPFGLTKEQWNANLKDPNGVEDFEPELIEDWRMHCQLFPGMVSRDQDALHSKLGRNFSMAELYCAQWPAITPEKATGDLTVSLIIVAPMVKAALEKLHKQQPVITDPAQPMTGTEFGPGPFKDKAPRVMTQLLKDFPKFNAVQAAAVLGNIGHESAGFTAFHQIGLPFEKGGIGWCQWTNPGRRDDFEAFCSKNKLDIKSDEASYRFLVHEMKETAERKVVESLSETMGLKEATDLFMKVYERPGEEAPEKRLQLAQTALDAFNAGDHMKMGSAMELTENFSLEEFTHSSTALALKIDNNPTPEHLENLKNLVAHMEEVRALFNLPIEITSGYRNPEVNKAVGGVPNSAHALGHAADFHVHGVTDLEAAKKIRDSKLKFDQLIFEKNRCVHFSVDPQMRRQVLRQPGGPGSTVFDGLEP
jgi:zinc D-Ala-D-Ala carboxypeptidase